MNHRWLARGFVVALHAAALLALWLHRPPPLAEPGERRFTTVRLVAPERPRLPPPDRPRPVAAPLRSGPVVLPPVINPDAPRPDNIPTAPATTPAPPVAPADEPPRTTLRLTLPPGYAASANAARNAARDLALSDPRSNTPRLTLEDRIADATGGAGAWVEEPKDNHALVVGALGDRRTVMRRGNTCVEVFRSRIADSDPFNNSVAPRTVPMVGKPYKCR